MRMCNKFVATNLLLFISWIVVMESCRPSTKEVPVETVDTIAVDKEQFNEEAYMQEVTAKRLAARNIALAHIQEDQFFMKTDSFEISIKNHFNRHVKTVKAITLHYFDRYTDIYQIAGDTISTLLEAESTCTYADTIFDVNDDGLADLLIYHSSLNGCCRREIFDTYLQKPDGTFNEMIELMNPVFSPKEKVIRGLAYGHDHTLYKFKWKGFTLDTIEYIHPPTDTAATYVIRTNKYDDLTKGDTLPTLPKEYLHLIQNLNTFTESLNND